MHERIFKCIEPRAHFEHLDNHTLLPLTHAPALIMCTIRARPPFDVYLSFSLLTSKENDYVITKVINFVLDSPARKMKAKNKIMHFLYLKK